MDSVTALLDIPRITPTTDRRTMDVFLTSYSSHSSVFHKSDFVFLHYETDPAFTMHQPIPVEIVYDDYDGVVSSDSIFNVYGVGKNLQESLDDYFMSLKEYFEIIEDSMQRNSSDEAVFKNLSRFIARR
ncbi:MAG TPA: hypothetical protein PLO13_02530 [Anaerolineaceae bacterium]|nr:hypothetical protein [Anaerolineaceae bacterium]